MLHKTRQWSIHPKTLDEIVESFIHSDSWVLCNGLKFELNGKEYLLLNDSTSEDAIQEYALCRIEEALTSHYLVTQLDSLTITWARRDGREALKELITKGTKYEDWKSNHLVLTHEQGDTCPLCA
jgi:hypothetical protein